MNNDEQAKKEVMIPQLIELMREEVWLSIRWQDAAAKVVGVHPTDLTLLAFIYEFGPVSAGRLSAAADLTTGATTAAITRLEGAGFVERQTHKKDKRKVMVRSAQIPARFGKIRRTTQKELNDTLSRYTLSELQVIISSRRQVAALLRRQIESLKSQG